MSIKLILLKTGEKIITDVKELISEEKPCGYLLENPLKVEIINQPVLLSSSKNVDMEEDDVTVSIYPWIELTTDKKIPITMDTAIAIVEPIESLKNLYLEKLNGRNESQSEVSFTEE